MNRKPIWFQARLSAISRLTALVGAMVLALLLSGGVAEARSIDPDYANRIANAIYLAEGGKKARVPYGIMSVRVKNHREARRVCLNTIRNNWVRWHESGRAINFIDFLGNRYCPPSVDAKGNVNWRRNVKYFLKKTEAES